MADLIMTIDSDSDSEQKQQPKKKQQQGKPAQPKTKDDEEILLAHSVILQDTEENVQR